MLQIPAQAIKSVTERVQDSACTLAHYTQDCKSLGEVRAAVGSLDAACLAESPVDVGYVCKKCQMVYPVRDACLTHQRMACYAGAGGGGGGGRTMLKLEQLQYECRVCADKFCTLAEVKVHCQQESHRSRVHKLGASVLPPSTTTTTASTSSSSSSPASSSSSSSSVTTAAARSSPKPATPSGSTHAAAPPTSTSHSFSSGSPGHSGDRASSATPSSFAASPRKSPGAGASLGGASHRDEAGHPKAD